MKHITSFLLFISLLLLCALPVFAEDWITVGADFSGKHKVTVLGVSGTADVNNGFSIGYESISEITDKVSLGIGMEYQLPRSQSGISGNFNFFPIYGIINCEMSSNGVKPYLAGRFGYNFFYGDSTYANSLTGGLYYALGVGIKPAEKMKLELLYSVNKGKASGFIYVPGYGLYRLEGDIEYSKINLVAGFKF